MTERKYEIGLVGLGVMGRNLALNMADNNVAVFGLDADVEKVAALKHEGDGKPVTASVHMDEMIANLRPRRTVLLLVPAGATVDAVIDELLPLLDDGDLIIDGGNSHFTDTNRRGEQLAEHDLAFMGMGISGGEKGARYGPSLMPGGSRKAFERMKPILEAVAAKVDGEPCAAFLGPGSAGHFVKMVHNGIEYGVMQLLAESYDLMKRIGTTNDEMAAEFAGWHQGELSSFLVEITSSIFRKADDDTGLPLLDLISDTARGKGTGKWTSQEAMQLQAPIPTIDMAVTMRDLSGFDTVRQRLAEQMPITETAAPSDTRRFLDQVRNGFHAAMMLTYAQGMSLLYRASEAYGYDLNFETVSRIWRGGCIIRTALLDSIRNAYQRDPHLSSLLLDAKFGKIVAEKQNDLRNVICEAVRMSVPVGGMMSALAYYDAFRAQRLPTNLVQAQRDFFGAHTYERIDKPGKFHTEWE